MIHKFRHTAVVGRTPRPAYHKRPFMIRGSGGIIALTTLLTASP